MPRVQFETPFTPQESFVGWIAFGTSFGANHKNPSPRFPERNSGNFKRSLLSRIILVSFFPTKRWWNIVEKETRTVSFDSFFFVEFRHIPSSRPDQSPWASLSFLKLQVPKNRTFSAARRWCTRPEFTNPCIRTICVNKKHSIRSCAHEGSFFFCDWTKGKELRGNDQRGTINGGKETNEIYFPVWGTSRIFRPNEV